MKKTLIILLSIYCLGINAQSDFSVSPTFVNLTKSADFGIAHDYIQIYNLLGQDFDMRWVAVFASKSGCPAGWVISLADPDSNYVPIIDNDSADFILSSTNPTYNKLTIGVDHNGVVGNCEVNFRLYSISDPTSEILIGYNISITPGVIGVNELNFSDNNTIYPNPSSGYFIIKGGFKEGSVFDGLGNKLFRITKKEIDLSNYPKGIYFYHYKANDKVYSGKLIVE
jgi:hypothetical protein